MGHLTGERMGIDELILEGNELAEISDKTELEDKYDIWCSKVRRYMKENNFSDTEQQEAKVNMVECVQTFAWRLMIL